MTPDNNAGSFASKYFKEANECPQVLEAIFDTNLIAISVLKAIRNEVGKIVDFRFDSVNAELERQIKRYGLKGKMISGVYAEPENLGILDAMIEVVETGKSKRMEFQYQTDGRDKWYQSMFIKMDGGVVMTNLDITEIKEAELSLDESDIRKSRELYEAVVLAQEEERKRIAEDIHNGLGQILYATKLSLDNIKLESEVHGHALVKVKNDSVELLGKAILDTRAISHQLSPPILQDFGLKVAIEDMCDQFLSTLEIKVEYRGSQFKITYAIEIAVYRIVQELILNVMKHSHATTASVRVEIRHHSILLEVEDNGIGFKPSRTHGIGMQSIKGKVKLLHGHVKIASKTNKGTKVSIGIPTLKGDFI